jgi:AraC-like DNA-binding protein
MQKAYNLLLSNKPSEEVAVTLGYQDYSTFYRSFVSTFSISPKQFKK